MATEGGSRGEIGDAWGVDGVVQHLNAETTPRLRRRDGTWSTVAVHEVAVEGDRARLVISTGRTPKLIEPAGTFEVEKVRTFAEPIRVAGGVGPYTGEGDVPARFSFESIGDELFLVGSVLDQGPYEFAVAARDAAGSLSPEIVVTVEGTTEWLADVESLLQYYLQSEAQPLTPGELEYMDSVGNDNGRYDVGDLRKWLRTSGS